MQRNFTDIEGLINAGKYQEARELRLSIYEEIKKLIKKNKIKEAFKQLKPAFDPNDFDNKAFALLDQIIRRALAKNNIILAATAASYRLEWSPIDIPKKTSWDTIIKKANKQGGFPKIDLETKFLEPHFSTASADLNSVTEKIWRFFKDHNWKVPGYKITFDAVGNRGRKNILAYYISEIRGKDFIIGFDHQDFEFIAAPNFAMHFYSRPIIYKYTGENWSEEIKRISCDGWLHNTPDWQKIEWQKIECDIPYQSQKHAEKAYEFLNMSVMALLDPIYLSKMKEEKEKRDQQLEKFKKCLDHNQLRAKRDPSHFSTEMLTTEFDSWIKKFNHKQMSDNDHLVEWLNEDDGAKFVHDYKEFCQLAAELNKKGYQTTPPPNEKNYETGVTLFKTAEKQRQENKINRLAKNFEEWLGKNVIYGLLDTNKKLNPDEYSNWYEKLDNQYLLRWLSATASNNEIDNYPVFCDVANALAKKNYKTNPPPSEEEFYKAHPHLKRQGHKL